MDDSISIIDTNPIIPVVIQTLTTSVIGDKPVDIEMGIKAECKTIFVLTGHGKKQQNGLEFRPDIIVNDLFEGAEYIKQNDNQKNYYN